MSSDAGGQGRWKQGASVPAGGAPAARGGKRFTAATGPDQSPAWFRILVPVASLVVVIGGLLALLYLFVMGSVRPALVAWAVTDYADRSIPLNEYALADVAGILESKSFSDGTQRTLFSASNSQTLADFERFCKEVQNVKEDVLVVYISSHGISTSSGPTLLASEFANQSSGGFSAKTLLSSLAAARPRHKLLILDATRIDMNLELGLLRNDFVEQLEAEFKTATESLDPKEQSFWVLVSSGRRERAWASSPLGHSVFGWCVSYALRGGNAVDAPGKRGQKDGYLSTQEMVDYVVNRVSSWSPDFRDGAIQRPTLLAFGDSFRLIRVDDELTEQEFLHPTAPPKGKKPAPPEAKAAEPKKEEKPAAPPESGGATATAEAPAKEGEPPSGSESPPPTEAPAPGANFKKELGDIAKQTKPIFESLALPPEDEKAKIKASDVLTVLGSYWKLRDTLSEASLLHGRPHQRVSLEQEWLRLERLALAGEARQAALDLRDRVVPMVDKLLKSNEARPYVPQWSVAFAQPEVKDDLLNGTLINLSTLLNDPSEKNRKLIETSAAVEARLVQMMLDEFTVGDQWVDGPTAKLAYEVRRRAEEAGKLEDPKVLPLVDDRLAAADRNRRQGERLVRQRRAVAAQTAFQQANQGYVEVVRRANRLNQSMRDIERVAGEAILLVRWLGRDPAGRSGRRDDVEQLNQFLESLAKVDLEAADAATSIEELAKSARGIEEQAAKTYVAETNEHTTWRRREAAFELLFLPGKQRQRMLLAHEAFLEDPPTRVDSRSKADSSTEELIQPYPLEGLLRLVGGESEGLIRELSDLEVKGGSMDVHARAAVGEKVSRFLFGEAGKSLEGQAKLDGTEGWRRELRWRVLSPLRALITSDPVKDDVAFQAMGNRQRQAWLEWELTRLRQDETNLGRNWYAPSAALGEKAILRADPRARFSLKDPSARLEPNEPVIVLPSDSVEKEWKIAIRSDSSPVQRLVIDWYADRDRLRVASPEGKLDDAQLIIQVPVGGVSNTWSVPITWTRLGEEVDRPRVRAWLEHNDGSVTWLEPTVDFPAAQKKPAEIVMTWDDGGGDEKGVIDLYPNQRIPLQLAIRKNAEGPLPLVLKVQSGSREPVLFRMQLTAEQMGEIPLAITKEAEVEIEGKEVDLLLYKESELLDERKLVVRVGNVAEQFVPQVDVDQEQRKVFVHVERIARADSLFPVPVAVTIRQTPTSEPVARGEIAPSSTSVDLPCNLPSGEGPWPLEIDVAGVPRVFRYTVGPQTQSDRPNKEPALRVDSPAGRSVWLFDAKRTSLPVRLAVDGVSVEQAEDFQLRVGVDADDNGRLDGNDTVVRVNAPAGRTVKPTLSFVPEGPTVTVGSFVGDVELDLKAPWLVGKNLIRAELAVGSKQIPASVDVYFLRNAPEIKLDGPLDETPVTVGQGVRAVVAPQDKVFVAIDGIEFAFDKNRNGKWEDADVVMPMGVPEDGPVRFDAKGSPIRVDLPTDGLEAGQLSVFARSRIRFEPSKPGEEPVVKYGTVHKRTIRIVPEAKSEGEAMKNEPGSVVGEVLSGGSTVSRQKVELVGVGTTTTDADGKFRFEKVPPMTYVVRASTTIPLPRQAEETVKVEPGKEASVKLDMKFKTGG